MAFVGYIATMTVALVAVVAAWFVIIGPPPPAAHQLPRPAIGQIGYTTALEAAPQPKTQSAQQALRTQQAQSGTWGPAVVHRAADGAAAADADENRAAAEQAAAAEKAKQLKTARYRKRKEQEARQRQEHQAQQEQQDDHYGQYGRTYSRSHSTALGYDQESPRGYDREGPRDRPPPPPFFLFGPSRY